MISSCMFKRIPPPLPFLSNLIGATYPSIMNWLDGEKWWLYNISFISVISTLSSKILSSESFGGRFRASLVPACKMTYSDLCRKVGFILLWMSLRLAPEKLFTLSFCFWDSGPGCKPEAFQITSDAYSIL